MSTQPDVGFIALQAALAGEYSLDRELGRGGMGIVYLAREVRLARSVAIKVLPPDLASRPDLRAAFLRESQTAAGLNHPNIVPVYAAGERDGFVFIAMAYVEGITLGERIRTRGPLLPGQAARLLREVAWALAYAHAAGIVHRDVTAENILLERGTDRAIVMDFGIASAMQSAAIDGDGRVMGNAHYVSPEQAVGEPLDARSDLYSLGVCGFYALTGRLPFDGDTPASVVTKHLTDVPPAISTIASAVPARLGQAVDRCLAKQPLRRYRNAESFAEAIDLAFEHAKEIPAPLRVWIRKGEAERPAWFGLIGLSAIPGIAMVLSSQSTASFFVPVGIATLLTALSGVLRLRRVLKAGYHVDDLSAALREHQLLRSEEVAYEQSQRSPLPQKIAKFALGISLTTLAVVVGVYGDPFADSLIVSAGETLRARVLTTAVSSIGIAFASSVQLVGDFLRSRLSAKLSAMTIGYWRSRMAARIAKVAGLGLKPPDRPAVGMPMLTEVALGRATDHLFQALPKATRRELAALPPAVRQLENDASTLRESIEAIDDQLVIFERGSGDMDVDHRAQVEHDLRQARDQSAQRLAATVAALENIRLDLLRLQMGSVGVASVTASLEAAMRVGEQISEHLDAHGEVERLLENHTPERIDDHADDDADTPVTGVPAARG